MLLPCAAIGAVGKWESCFWISSFPRHTCSSASAPSERESSSRRRRCGNVGISPPLRDFQGGVETVGSVPFAFHRFHPPAFPQRSVHARNLYHFRLGNPIAEQNREALQRGLPVLHRHRPLFGDMLQGQVQQLQGRLLIGKRSPCLDYFSQRHVQRLDCVGGVDNLPDVRRIGEERRQV